jgi:hypothetical protein
MHAQNLGPKIVLPQPPILVLKLQNFLHHERCIACECVARQRVAPLCPTCLRRPYGCGCTSCCRDGQDWTRPPRTCNLRARELAGTTNQLFLHSCACNQHILSTTLSTTTTLSQHTHNTHSLNYCLNSSHKYSLKDSLSTTLSEEKDLASRRHQTRWGESHEPKK